MKNQQHTPGSGQSMPQNDEIDPKDSQGNSKEPSILDKVKEQIKKIKQLKEKGAWEY